VRIALITRRYPPLVGGAEKVLSYLAPALAAEGAEVTVLTSMVAGSAAVESARPNCTVTRLATARARFLGTWLYMRQLKVWLTRHPVDIAYVSMLKHDAFVAIGVGERLGFPVVLRPEGAGATGDLAWQRWGRFGRTIAKRCQRADALVAISVAVRKELLEDGYAPGLVHDIPNGVPVPSEPWSPRADAGRGPVVVFVGRLAREKGLDVLVAAWPRVLGVHRTARLRIIGEGPERAALEQQAYRLGVREEVEMPGEAADVTPLLRAADVFVLPSREEGMSIALLEAMALGMPVVATAIPGNQAIVTDQVHGRLAIPDDPEALSQAILAQLADPATGLRCGEAARARVIDEYSITAMARRHMALFDSLIEARTGAAPRQ
jgi:glycosyltransferase involved in cell wall biosynthesis